MTRQNDDSASFRRYLQIAKRRKWTILQAVVLVPLAVYAVSMERQHLYRASTEVLLTSQSLASTVSGVQDTSANQPDRNAETQAGLARVPEIAHRVLAAVGLSRSTRTFLEHSGVSASANSDLLKFWVVDKNRGLAVRLANEYARQFRSYRLELDTASLAHARQEVARRIAALRDAKELDSGLYARLVDKEQQLATIATLQTSNVHVVGPADHAAVVQPRPKRDAAVGLALGLVLGIALALIREALDTRPHSADEIGERLGIPLLARLPRPPRKLRGSVPALETSDGPHGEAFRMLKTNLEFANRDHGCRSIIVTSAVAGEGKTTTIACLSAAVARAGAHVAVVDLDIRKPLLHRLFELERTPGVTDVVLGGVELDHALTRVPLPATPGLSAVRGNGGSRPRAAGSLHVLAAGTLAPHHADVVDSATVADILRRLTADFDLVFVDSPPLLNVGDALALSTKVDGLLLVTRLNVIDHRMLGELRRMLEKSPAATLGFVVTDAQADGDYGYGYGYGGAPAGEPLTTSFTAARST